MCVTELHNDVLRIVADVEGALEIRSPVWEALRIGSITAAVTANGEQLQTARRTASTANGELTVTTEFAPFALRLAQRFEILDHRTLRLRSELLNESGQEIRLQSVQLLRAGPAPNAAISFSPDPSSLRVFEQGGYWARVRQAGAARDRGAGGEADFGTAARHHSQTCWAAYDTTSRMALVVGYETTERWNGEIATEEQSDGTISAWSLGFDGGDLLVEPGERLVLEDVLLLVGPDPWELLEAYSDILCERHQVRILPQSPVSWCSWYPYRLGVTEERVLANGRIAAERLKPLGLTIMELDLGWERGWLPNAFEENDQFPHGLAWLAERLNELGFRLGAWKGPFTISELAPLAREHPEWLLGSEEEKPLPLGEWFWEPHGQTYALDLTHPGAQEWLRQKIRSLAERGVRYLKPDFIGMVGDGRLRNRHDRHIVAGGGTEAARIGLRIIREEMERGHPEALVLNCGGPELPGTGNLPLLYTCEDTGNTGYVGWAHARTNYGGNLAGHLFKHRRWGILQPSCMCVGLPGTLEEARVRATATFLSGGQVDIGDDLTVLPEDRWPVLLATLPPLGIAVRPVDLFEPISVSSLSYEGMCRGQGGDVEAAAPEGSRVWHLPVAADWDEWHLVGLFDFDLPAPGPDGRFPLITRFELPLERLGIDPDGVYWAYEFWSGQFLGEVPATRENPKGYAHPGDAAALIATPAPGLLEVSFFGPAVKLLLLRRARSHPWVVGTTFHQSGGCELANVVWDERGVLTGELRRPPGQQGFIVIAGGAGTPTSATVGGRPAQPRAGANGAVVLPVVTETEVTPWEVRWG